MLLIHLGVSLKRFRSARLAPSAEWRSPWPSMLEGHGFGEWARPAGHWGCIMFIQVVGAGEFGRSRRKEEEDGGGEVTQFLGHLMSVALEP